MFFCFKYFLLILSFNQCFGASHLIPTAVYSPPAVKNPNRHYMGSGPMNTEAANYYPIYSLPLGNNPSYGELQYSASYAQPNIEPLNGSNMKSLVNVNANSGQKQRSSQKPTQNMEVQRPGSEPADSFKIPNIKYAAKRVNQRQQQSPVQNRPVQSQQISTNNANQKPLIPMYLKAQISATTLTPNYQINANVRPVSMKARKIKLGPQLNSTLNRLENIRFNWPKTGQQTVQQNISRNQQILYHEIPQEREVIRSQSEPQSSDQSNYDIYQRQRYGESKHNFKYDSNFNTDPTLITTTETDIYRESTTPSTVYTTEQTTVITPATKEIEDTNNSDKKDKLSSIDSLLSYQTQYFEMEKPSKQNYEQNEQNIEHVHLLTNPGVDNTDTVSIPENEVSYSQTEPEPESEPELLREQYTDDDKELYSETVDSNSGPELKTLLQQFIQQLDLMKFVATKQLYKNTELGQPEFKSIGEVVQTDSQPLTLGSKNNYNEYQTGRSFEQNLSNFETKLYKDTDERTGRKYPCKKPFHAGALPNIGMPNLSNHHY